MKKAPPPSLDERLISLRSEFGFALAGIEEKVEVVREGFEAGKIASIEERCEELADAAVGLMVWAARVVEVEKLKG